MKSDKLENRTFDSSLKFMKKLVALIYKYYLYKNFHLAYLRALLTFLVIILLHLYLVFTVFGIFTILPKWYLNNVEMPAGITADAFGVLLLLICLPVLKMKNLREYSFPDAQLETSWKNLIIYNSCVLFTLLLVTYL